jgi:hypothetical protein
MPRATLPGRPSEKGVRSLFYASHRTAGSGHLYQGRFKSFPVQRDFHLTAVCHQVVRNSVQKRPLTPFLLLIRNGASLREISTSLGLTLLVFESDQ